MTTQPQSCNADSTQELVAADMVGVQANLFDARSTPINGLNAFLFTSVELTSFPELIRVILINNCHVKI